jgi:FHA domain
MSRRTQPRVPSRSGALARLLDGLGPRLRPHTADLPDRDGAEADAPAVAAAPVGVAAPAPAAAAAPVGVAAPAVAAAATSAGAGPLATAPLEPTILAPAWQDWVERRWVQEPPTPVPAVPLPWRAAVDSSATGTAMTGASATATLMTGASATTTLTTDPYRMDPFPAGTFPTDRPGADTPPPSDSPRLPMSWAHLALDDGRTVTVTSTALLGRHPAPRPGENPGALVIVTDPQRSVSKTHLAVGLDDAGVWVADRGSTNGTVVTLPDGQRILCVPERRVRLALGASVAFGDAVFRLTAVSR